ncbi:7-cyano-7-deazaguanine synthase [Thermodesulfobacteriota bacterium]
MNNKALALFSGGLDSTLAIRVIQEQGIEVTALNFMTPFCNCTNKSSGCKSEAKRVADELKVTVKIMNKGKDYLEVVRNPKFGYGKNMNPCVDCRIFMHKAAKEYMKEIGASFIITGEVLGQRPMSQRRDTINIIDRESGLKGLVLRPLSAQLFPLTIPEEEGVVDREKLLKISGRSRKPQMQLADDFKIKGYQCPAGGCLLTDVGFARRIKDLFKYSEDINMLDVHMLKTGRHFRLNENTKLIVSRDESEGNKLNIYSGDRYTLLIPEGLPGPTSLIVGEPTDEIIDLALRITAKYYKKGSTDIKIKITHNDDSKVVDITEHADDELIDSKII